MLKKTMDIIIAQVQNILIDKGFTRYDLKTDNKTLATFINNTNYYSITQELEKKTINLLVGSTDGNKICDDAKVISTWLFDPDTDGEKEASSIGKDFVEMLSGPSIKKNIKTQNKGTEENTSSPIFFINRLATLFPDLKDKIQYEKKNFESFRHVTFIKEYVVSEILSLLKEPNQKSTIKKLGKILNDNYDNGDLDVRGLITIVILNSIEEETEKTLIRQYLSDDLQKVFDEAQKLKGKKIKPEKIQKRKSFMSRILESNDVKSPK